MTFTRAFLNFSAIFQHKNRDIRKKSECPIIFIEFVWLKRFFDLLEAILTNALAVKENYIVCICAEYAGGLIFLQNDSVFVGENFKRVLFSDVHCLADADGEHYAAELVYFSYYSGWFHRFILLWWKLCRFKSIRQNVIFYILILTHEKWNVNTKIGNLCIVYKLYT